MKAVHHKITIDVDQLVSEELPYMRAFYLRQNELHQDVKDLFSFPVNNAHSMPFYTISEKGCDDAFDVFTDSYSMMVDAVGRALRDRSALYRFFDCDFLRDHGHYFVPYAAYTFRTRGMIGQTMYGRFDAAFDPVSEQVTGLYEFNGDTPVMLFESVNLQNRLTREVTGSSFAQFNNYYEKFNEMMKAYQFGPDVEFAVVFDGNYVEDSATCETLSQFIGEHAICYYRDLADLEYDYENPQQPFVLRDYDRPLDVVFVLSPWEEMVSKFPHAFRDWERWANNVALLEPAWRWFMSHKGIWAYITHLMESDPAFNAKWSHLPVLPTYTSPESFIKAGRPYVSKPVLGRLSSNIEIYDGKNTLLNASNGYYGDCERVYQAFCAPHKVEGRNNFIAGCWMVSKERTESTGHEAEAASFCIREFDAPVLEISNERFIPHLVV
ncbi:glutathionylspermidine synthase family protein [Pseudomonas syringae pv. actinidiae]|nr:glutathionylspermidine synthase family protein [Pseudomonas syringae pv. actinidiae]